jgi:hypothetical protein
MMMTTAGVVTIGGVATTVAGTAAGDILAGGTVGGTTNPRVLTFARVCQRHRLLGERAVAAPRGNVTAIGKQPEMTASGAKRTFTRTRSELVIKSVRDAFSGRPLRPANR